MLHRQVFDKSLLLDANQSLANYEHLASEIAPSSTDTDLRAASVTESMALLMQEAEYQQTISGIQVLALLPTVLPVPTTVTSLSLVASNVTTAASSTPIPTATPTIVMPTDVPPTALPTLEATESQVVITTSDSESTDLPPTAIATSTLWPTPTPQPPTITMYALESANVRSQPSQDQAVITVLRQGISTEIIGEDNSGKWWHVRLKDGTSGWVAKFLLSVDKPVISSGNNNSSGNNDPSGNNNPSDGSNNGDFGCDHPGNYCNAPRQNGTQPSSSNNSGNNNSNNNNSGNNNSSSQTPPNNQPNEHSQSNSGNGHKS
jgi:hypothetical protein